MQNYRFDYFSSKEVLEPRCPGCDSKVDYGVTTSFDDEKNAHVCNTCGHVFE